MHSHVPNAMTERSLVICLLAAPPPCARFVQRFERAETSVGGCDADSVRGMLRSAGFGVDLLRVSRL